MSVVDEIAGFIQKYYIDPMVMNQGYTFPMTITYGLILALMVYLVYPRIKKKVPIDEKFIIGVFPYVVLGGVARVLEDAAEVGINPIFKTIWLISPLMYVTMFVFTSVMLLISLYISPYLKQPYYKIWAGIGVILCLVGLALLPYRNLDAGLFIVLLTTGWFLLFYGLDKVINWKLMSLTNIGLLTSHLFDASATYTAVTYYGYWEQHVLPSFLIDIFGPLVMFPLKVIVVLVVLHFLDDIKEKEQRIFWKFVVLILGLALGVRDSLRVVAGV